MASAEILGYQTGSGQWPDGYEYCWIRSAPAAVTSTLPAWISSVTCAEGDPVNMSAGDSRAIRVGPGSGAAPVLQTSGGTGVSMTIAAASETAPYLIAFRAISLTASRVYTVAVKTADGVTTLATGTTPDSLLGVWIFCRITGSARIDLTGSFPRYQGVLFKADGSPLRLLSCIEPGSTGLFA